MSIRRLLTACGWTKLDPAIGVKLESTTGAEPPLKSVDDVLVTRWSDPTPVAADFGSGGRALVLPEATSNIERMTAALQVLKRAHRVGVTLFSDSILDQLEEAGCRLENREDGVIIIHMPGSGEIPGDYAVAQAMSVGKLYAHELQREDMFFPIAGPRDVHTGPDYLKHDPTKRHSRRRPTTKRNRNR